MIKYIIILFIFLLGFQTYALKLTYTSNGNISDSEHNKITPNKIRALLANNEKLLTSYNAGRSKKTLGNVLLIGGFALVATDLLVGLNADVVYPSVLTYIGLAAIVIAIPVKIGFQKKIKNVVEEYNKGLTVGYNDLNNQKLELITNTNGLGFRLTLN